VTQLPMYIRMFVVCMYEGEFRDAVRPGRFKSMHYHMYTYISTFIHT
jgi:hypothetical protein